MYKFSSSKDIDLQRDFTFDFQTNVGDNSVLDNTDFVLYFALEDDGAYNGIKITNIPSGYKVKESGEYTLKLKNGALTFFDEELIFVNEEPYEKYSTNLTYDIENFYKKDGNIYVKTKKYQLHESDTNYIRRLNPKNAEGLSVRPIELKSYKNGEIISTDYFINGEKVFDSNYNHVYRIVVSNYGQIISLWAKIDNKFEKIKTFSFPQKLEKGKVKLWLDANMVLSDLHFSFFEADIV